MKGSMLVIVAVIGLGSWLGWFGWHGAVLIVLALGLGLRRLLCRLGRMHVRLAVGMHMRGAFLRLAHVHAHATCFMPLAMAMAITHLFAITAAMVICTRFLAVRVPAGLTTAV